VAGILADKDRIFLNIYGQRDWGLEGAKGARRVERHEGHRRQTPEWICDQIKASGLRGRGGAGFATGLKWTFMPKQESERPHYLLVNADESEPGACKDRDILRNDPHLLIEGCLIACRAMRAHTAYIYIRGEYVHERERLLAAIKQAYDARLNRTWQHPWLGLRRARPARRRRLHLRRRDGADGELRGQEGPAAPEAPVPGGRRHLRLPDDGEQRRDRLRGRHDPAARADWFAGFGTEKSTGTKLFAAPAT